MIIELLRMLSCNKCLTREVLHSIWHLDDLPRAQLWWTPQPSRPSKHQWLVESEPMVSQQDDLGRAFSQNKRQRQQGAEQMVAPHDNPGWALPTPDISHWPEAPAPPMAPRGNTGIWHRPNPGTGQRVGEHPQQFLKRCRKETSKEHNKRLQQQKLADNSQVTNSANLFVWQPDELGPDIWTRQKVLGRDVRQHKWETTPMAHRVYNVHQNEWDLWAGLDGRFWRKRTFMGDQRRKFRRGMRVPLDVERHALSSTSPLSLSGLYGGGPPPLPASSTGPPPPPATSTVLSGIFNTFSSRPRKRGSLDEEN